MSVIRKTTFTLTVLHPAEDHAESLPMEQVLHEIDNGMWIGSTSHVSTVDVPNDKVVDELQAIGNDGTFFEDYLEGSPTDGDRNDRDCPDGAGCSIEIDTAGDRFCVVCGLGWGSAQACSECEAMTFSEAQQAGGNNKG